MLEGFSFLRKKWQGFLLIILNLLIIRLLHQLVGLASFKKIIIVIKKVIKATLPFNNTNQISQHSSVNKRKILRI